MADDRKADSSEWFNEVIMLDSIRNPYAREPGYIYIRQNPKVKIPDIWKTLVEEAKAPFRDDLVKHISMCWKSK